MSASQNHKAAFNFIRYANCWEDADILLQGLQPTEGSRIFSIASAGDNSFSLLTTHPEIVVAADINPTQLNLTELKKTAYQNLGYEELLGFLGFTASSERKKIFDALKQNLSIDCRNYFEANLHLITNGIISQGKFEKYFQVFSQKILPWIHSTKTIDGLIAEKTPEEQKVFYAEHWNTWRWKLLFKFFFSRYVMGRFGRDPSFLKEVDQPVGMAIFNQSEKHLQSVLAQNNFILYYNLKGNFGNMLPHYMRPENYKVIKSNLERLHLQLGYAHDIAGRFGSFQCMNLSNIFEYMNRETFTIAAHQLLLAMKQGGRLAYWNLMVPRRIAQQFPERAAYCEQLSSQLTSADKGFFYISFIIDEVL